MTNTQELKPCPMDGGVLKIFEHEGPRTHCFNNDNVWSVMCDNNDCRFCLESFSTKEDAVIAANTRAAEAVPTVDMMLSEEVIISRLDAAIAYYDGRKMPKQVSDTAVYHLNNLFYAAKAHRASMKKAD